MRNILFASAGRRVSLVKQTQQTIETMGLNCSVLAADMNPEMAPACYVADKSLKVQCVRCDEYPQQLLDICHDHDIGIIIPTIDTELPILAQNKSRFEQQGVHVMVSDKAFIDICADKRLTMPYLEALGIKCPRRFDRDSLEFPLLAKPYNGSRSLGVSVINSPQELSPALVQDQDLMFMELVDKSQYREFTVDMYYGRDNHVKTIVPRERLEVRDGEISKGITRKNFLVQFLRERMEHIPGVVGCICLQLFYHESDNDVMAIEINPRFGGGYPLSHQAGANFIAMLLEEYYLDKHITYTDDWQDNLLMLRHDSELFI